MYSRPNISGWHSAEELQAMLKGDVYQHLIVKIAGLIDAGEYQCA
jgi:hypothetical protein